LGQQRNSRVCSETESTFNRTRAANPSSRVH
jgi:hypothetical protein